MVEWILRNRKILNKSANKLQTIPSPIVPSSLAQAAIKEKEVKIPINVEKIKKYPLLKFLNKFILNWIYIMGSQLLFFQSMDYYYLF